MRVCGREFSLQLLQRIQDTVSGEPSISRGELSRRVCRWLDWRSSSGGWQEGGCRKALARLDRQGAIRLPPPATGFAFERRTEPAIAIEVPSVCGSLVDLGGVEIVPVTSRHCKDSILWRALLERHHYLGCPSPCGARLRYLIKSTHHGYLGALSFRSATWALRERDHSIGWSEAARLANLPYVLTNERFLILPSVRVDNLASHALAAALRRLGQDWSARYGVTPVLVETFVDPTRFEGVCYQATNWHAVGETAGRRDGVRKRILLYPLDARWRERLCTEPHIGLGEAPRPEAPAHWAEEEFGTIRLHDTRLKQRLFTLAQDFYNCPQASIPHACGSKARTMGAYRFFENKKITMDVILTPHTEATVERIKEHRLVLAPQDTTLLNYYHHPATTGLGPINTQHDQATGLILHDTLAFTEAGTPLGIVDAQCWARDPQQKGKRERRKQLPIEQKESMKWLRSFRKLAQIQRLCPETTLVSIGDRESDIYELFVEATQDPAGPKLLVRAARNRSRRLEQGPLWEAIGAEPIAGTLLVHIPKRGNRKARAAQLDVRFSAVQLSPPKNTSHPPIKAWAVYLLERASDEQSDTPIEWMLLTTMPVHTFEEAKQRAEWYSGRWGIEVYHRTLKSGCRIKDRQLGSAERLESCLAVDMVVAWRIYHMTMLGREVPEHPCTVFFEDIEWKALCCYYAKTPNPPKQPPTLAQAIRMLGSIGGHLGRNSDGMPGTQCLWRGLQRLDTAIQMYAVFKHQPLPNSWNSYPHHFLPHKPGPP